MKKIIKYYKNIVGVIFNCIGVICWMLGLLLAPQTPEYNLLICLVNLGFCIIGSIFIWLSIKINPGRIREVLSEDESQSTEHNYSPDFEYLYNQIILAKVNEIIEENKQKSIYKGGVLK